MHPLPEVLQAVDFPLWSMDETVITDWNFTDIGGRY